MKSKERISFVVVVVFLSLKVPGWLRHLLSKRVCAWNAKFHSGLHEWVEVRTYGRRAPLLPMPESQSKRKNVQGGQKRDVATIVYCFGRLQYASLFFFTYFHAPFCCYVASQLNTLCRCTSKCKALTTKWTSVDQEQTTKNIAPQRPF